MDSYKVLKYPLTTEKAIKLMETENKLLFVVDEKSDKTKIKQAAEELFKVKVVKVTTHSIKGQKRAYIKLSKENVAADVATQLGLM